LYNLLPGKRIAPHLIGTLVTAAALLGLSNGGCSGIDRPGPNVEDVPEGFFFDANASAARKVLEVEPLDQSGWFAHNANDDHSSIMITTYQGQIDEDTIRAARDTHAQRWGRKSRSVNGSDYGSVEEIEIDGQRAWAWEIVQYYKGDLCSIEWTAVVPYEDVTYAVEFFAGMENHMSPELIRKTVYSFEAD